MPGSVWGARGREPQVIVNSCCVSEADREKLARGPTPEAPEQEPPPEGDPYENMRYNILWFSFLFRFCILY